MFSDPRVPEYDMEKVTAVAVAHAFGAEHGVKGMLYGEENDVNVLFAYVAAGKYAYDHGIHDVVWAVHKGNFKRVNVYLDTLNTFMRAARFYVVVRASFVNDSRASILSRGEQTGAPLHLFNQFDEESKAA
ncbi:MAG: hypothetical protein UY07_C0001G0005 [Parcubacteria group bacterium GW2011_GWA1_47_8]|nr:MAG: hypothetical protein UY07_C0001G0005 [Parcubacteria group bacterium GW2011_GWA1_47_8]KKW07218.1 MAG: hypothetical protein UY42_C0016G0005 [Parcubacteria group bacterium GW2011_GWA2_49_16]